MDGSALQSSGALLPRSGCGELLVLFQLNRTNRPDTGEWMRGAAKGPMAVPQIPVDAPAAGAMAGVVGVRQRGALQDPEVRLDQIQPRGLGGRPDRLDPEPPQQGQESRMVVDVMQIVHNHEEPAAGVAGPQPTEGLADLDHALPTPKHPGEAVGVDIIEAQEL